MKAIVVTPKKAGSGRLQDVPDPRREGNEVLVRVQRVGVDGTDHEILSGEYGEAPPGSDYLIFGHESLGMIEQAGPRTDGLALGDWVVAIVRRPDPVPCPNCAVGQWDMCSNGQYTERGIKGRHGFLAEFYTEDPLYLVHIPKDLTDVAVLLEPLSIVEKAVEQIEKIQSRLVWEPKRAIVFGAGTIGLLASLLLRLRDLDVHVYDRVETGIKPDLAAAMGATYLKAGENPPESLGATFGPVDLAIEASGYSPLAFDAMDIVGPDGIICLTGVSGGSRSLQIPADKLNLEMVLMNKVAFGTVNANRRHFESGVRHLREIESRWPGLLGRMITKRVPLENYQEAIEPTGDHVKCVVEVASSANVS